MAIFTKRKDRWRPTPEPCHRCHERMGTVCLQFTAPPGARLAVGANDAWICDECLDAVRTDARGN